MSTTQQLQEAADKATQASAQADAWANGPINTTVQTDSGPVPTIAEFTRAAQARADAAIEALGWVLAGDFTAGCTVTDRNQYVLVVGGAGYRWDGALPKVVTPGSSPTPIAAGSWVLVGDMSLRGDLAAPGGSSSVGFLQSGSSSVARTSQDKMREQITPLDKGAVGDGVANDTAAFALIESQFQGRYVDLLGKTYLVDVLPSKCFYHNGRLKVGTNFVSLESLLSLGSSVTVTVGSSGDFQTINSAIKHLSEHYYKSYSQAATTPSPGYAPDNVSAVIRLLSGYIMSEQVLLRQTKLGWITIIADDPIVTISRAALTKIAYFQGAVSEMYPAFYAGDNSELPIIACKFQMDSTGVSTNRHFAVANRNSSGHIWPFSGCLNAGGHGIYAREGSSISCRLTVCDGAGDSAFIAANGGRLSAQGASGRNSTNGVTATDCSHVNFAGGVADHCAQYGVNCIEGSSVNCSSANLTFSGQYGIRASNCDKVSAYLADTSDCGVAGVWADQASTVSMKSGKADRSPTGIRAEGCSKVDFYGGSAVNCNSRGVFAISCSEISADNATLTGSGVNGALANIASKISLNGANCRKGASDSSQDIAIGNGSMISAASSTGGKSVAVNTISRDGFITF